MGAIMGNKYFISYTAITFPAPSPVGLASPWTEVTLFKYSHCIFHKSYYNRFGKRMVFRKKGDAVSIPFCDDFLRLLLLFQEIDAKLQGFVAW
jgi:hypothetical protein